MTDTVLALQAGSEEVADRLHVLYRLCVKRPGDTSKLVEQHLICAVNGWIAALDLLCTGFRPEFGDARVT